MMRQGKVKIISLNWDIVTLGFCPIHFTITFAGKQMFISIPVGNIVKLKIVKPGFHCTYIGELYVMAGLKSKFNLCCCTIKFDYFTLVYIFLYSGAWDEINNQMGFFLINIIFLTNFPLGKKCQLKIIFGS